MFFAVFSKTPQVHIFKTRNEEMRDEERGVELKHCLFLAPWVCSHQSIGNLRGYPNPAKRAARLPVFQQEPDPNDVHSAAPFK